MADLVLIEQLRQYLIDQGIVRAVDAAGSLPPCVLDPRDGAPQPGTPASRFEAETAIVTLRRTGQIAATERYVDQQIEQPTVDIIVRAFKSQQGELVQRQIRNVLVEKRLFTMGTLLVEWCHLWRGTQPLSADERSYDTVQSFAFGVRVKALAGLPYAP